MNMDPISVSVVGALAIVALVSGVIALKTLDRWRQDTGRAPMIHTGRGSWSRYLRSVQGELAPSVRQRIAVCNRITVVSIYLGMVVLFLDAV